VTRSQVVAVAIARTLYPRFARLNPTEATELGGRTFVSLGYIFGALCGPAIVMGGPFMTLWMGSDFAALSTPVLRLLIIGAWVNGIAFIPFSFLEGQRRPDLVAKLAILELFPFLLLLWILLHHYGLVGAALAWAARTVIDALLVFKVARFGLQYLARLLPAVILLSVAYGVAQLANASILSSLLASGLLLVIFLGCALAVDPTLRRFLEVLRNRLVEVTGW
jgi:O-antigen/teichoic acid export membrane protein